MTTNTRYRDGTLTYDTNKVSVETGLFCADVSLAQQHQKDEADINVMVERFGLAGKLPEAGSVPWPWQEMDVTDAQDLSFADMVSQLTAAQKSFMALPARVRGQFDNDPHKFVEFCLDPANIDDLRKWGLAIPAKVEQAAVPKVVVESGNGSGS